MQHADCCDLLSNYVLYICINNLIMFIYFITGGCDLLSNYVLYICINNKSVLCTALDVVVICFQIMFFTFALTTYVNIDTSQTLL